MAFLDENGLSHFWEKINDKFSITLLWENATPGSSFSGPQRVPISDLIKYKFVLIYYVAISGPNGDENFPSMAIAPSDFDVYSFSYNPPEIDVNPVYNTFLIYRRHVSVSSSSIVFSGVFFTRIYPKDETLNISEANITGSTAPYVSSAADKHLIPYRIYGIKNEK